MSKNNVSFFFLFLLPSLHFGANSDLECALAVDPSKIVVAGGSITEILYFIGEQNKIIGIDVTSNYPKETESIQSIGYVRNLSTEGVLSLNPTLILGENDMGPPMVVNQLRGVDVDLKIIPEDQTIEGIIEKILCIASIIGSGNKVDKIIRSDLLPIVDEINYLKNKSIIKNKKVMLILSMTGVSPIVAGQGTSGDAFIKMVGAQNIFDSFEGWKPVSEEAIIEKNPDFIIIPSRDVHKNSDVKSITTNPIFKNTKAGKENNFIFEDTMAMLGFGPRTIESALKVVKQLSK